MRTLNIKTAFVAFTLLAAPVALAQDHSPSGKIAFNGGAIAVNDVNGRYYFPAPTATLLVGATASYRF